jgi:hypothetical protein
MLSAHSRSPPADWQHNPGSKIDREAWVLDASLCGSSGDNERRIAWIKPGHAPELSQYEVKFSLVRSNGSSSKTY